MKFSKRLLQFEEKDNTKKYIIILFVVIILIIIILFMYLNRKTIVQTINNVTNKSGKTYNNTVEETLDEGKVYDKKSGLIIPKSGDAYSASTEDIIIKMTDIKGDTSGYTIDLEFSQKKRRT